MSPWILNHIEVRFVKRICQGKVKFYLFWISAKRLTHQLGLAIFRRQPPPLCVIRLIIIRNSHVHGLGGLGKFHFQPPSRRAFKCASAGDGFPILSTARGPGREWFYEEPGLALRVAPKHLHGVGGGIFRLAFVSRLSVGYALCD